MAGAGAKKRAEDNARTVRLLGAYVLICAGVYAAVRLGLRRGGADWTDWAGLAGTLAVEGVCWLSITAVARPVFDNGVMIDGGGDLSKGAVSYYFDLLYVTGFVQLLAAFTRYGWYVYAVVPLYGAYVVATKVAPLLGGGGGGGKKKEVEVDEATLRRMERAERRSERRRVKRF